MVKKELVLFSGTLLIFFSSHGFARKNHYSALLTPSQVVVKAYKNLMKRKFAKNLKITEFAEKRRTERLLKDYENGGKAKEEIEGFLNRIVDFQVKSEEVYGDLAVVSVKLKIRNIPTNPLKGMKIVKRGREFNTYTIEYLLKKFGAEWKIISKRTR